MAVKLPGYHFFNEDPIMVANFRTRCFWEGDIQEMSKAQSRIALPSFHKRFTKIQYNASVEKFFSKIEVNQAGPGCHNTFSEVMSSL